MHPVENISATAATRSPFFWWHLPEGVVVAGTVGWVLPFAWAVHRVTQESSEAALWVLMAGWAGWVMWSDWPAETAPRRMCAAPILIIWSMAVWLCSGLWPEDYWLVRASLLLAVPALIVATWGWRGLGVGWRAWLILALWGLAPLSGRWLEGPRHGEWLSEITAGAAAFGLWQTGTEVSHHGIFIQTAQGAVSVGLPCTAQPLVAMLLRLLLPAALALGLPWRRTLALAALTLPATFLISVVRVMLLAEIVQDKTRFNYWHGPDGGGWFTLVAAAGLALALVAWLPRPEAEVRRASTGALPRWTVAALAIATSLGIVVSLWRAPSAHIGTIQLAAPPGSGSWTVQEEAARSPEALQADAQKTSVPDWVRSFTYTSKDGAELRVKAAAIPRWLDGDPVAMAYRLRLIPWPVPEAWPEMKLPDGGGTGRAGQPEGRETWLVAVRADGEAGGTVTDWLAKVKQLPVDGVHWQAWWRGTAPLRDKRGMWLMIEWLGPDRPDSKWMAEIVSLWQREGAKLW